MNWRKQVSFIPSPFKNESNFIREEKLENGENGLVIIMVGT